MFIGVMYGLGACALWGMTYLLPVLLPQYDSMYIAISRALVMGLVSLILILIFVDKFRQLTRNDWIFSIKYQKFFSVFILIKLFDFKINEKLVIIIGRIL